MAEYNYGTHPQKWQDVKIGVYAIYKNEIKYAKKWLENIWNNGKGADYIRLLDTGSNDGTDKELLKVASELNLSNDAFLLSKYTITPWRFDIARNENLRLGFLDNKVDVLFCVDLDELVDERFWDDLRKIVFEHPNFHNIRYKYAWSHKSNGEPDWQFWYDKIHGPIGWKWQYPVHETLTCSTPEIYDGKTYFMNKDIIYLHHYPDSTKSRSNYLPLLKLRVEENPKDITSNFYLAREYSYYKMWEECSKQCELSLGLFTNHEDIHPYEDFFAAFCHLRGESNYHLKRYCSAKLSFQYGIRHVPHFKTNYICLAQLQAYENNPKQCYKTLRFMRENAKLDTSWMVEGWVNSKWKELQIIADAKCWEGNYAESFALIAYAKELITEAEKNSAIKQNFYVDYNFIKTEYEKRVLK